MKPKKNKNNYKSKLILFYVFQVLVTIAPVLVVIVLKKDEYINDSQKAFSLGFGGIIALTVMVLQIVGKLPRNLHIIIKLGLATLILWMLRPILDELCLLVTCAFGGELLAWLCFSKAIRNLKAKADYKDSETIRKAVEDGDKPISGRV